MVHSRGGGDEGHPEQNAASPSPSCDWRLSRAAREIVRVNLEHAWRKILMDHHDEDEHYNQHQQEPPPAEYANVWQLLEESLSIAADPHGGDCPLFPERDVGRYYELQAMNKPSVDDNVAAAALKLVSRPVRQASIPGAVYRESKPRQLPATFRRCGICNRTFTSRYYLDRHWDRKHSPPSPFWRNHRHQHGHHHHHHHDNDHESAVSDPICPASDWCGRFLTRRDCHDAALELEPHYGPGSAGDRAGDRDAVHRRLVREAHGSADGDGDGDDRHRCSSSSTTTTTNGKDKTTAACHEMIRNCFGASDDGDDASFSSFSTSHRIGLHLNATLCNSQQQRHHYSCDGLGGRVLHLLAHPAGHHRSSLLHPDRAERTWREAWRSEEEHFGATGSVLIILAVLCFYAYHCLACHDHHPAIATAMAEDALQPNKNLSRRKPFSHRGGATRNKPALKLPPVEPPTTHVKQH